MGFKTAEWFAPEESPGRLSLDDPEVKRRFLEKQAKAAALREQIQRKLETEVRYDLAVKLQGCGLPFPLVCAHCGDHKTVETRCKRRWCPACAGMIARKRLQRYQGAVALMRHPTFLTLTIRNSSDPESLRKLRKDWSRMRRRQIIAARVAGGIVALEITNTGEGWHPHLHAIIDCPWLSISTPRPQWSDTAEEVAQKCAHAQFELSRLWAQSCGQDDAVVWVRRCRGNEALAYTLQYAISGSDLADSPDPISPLIDVIEKTRLVSAFGNLYGRTAEMDADEKPAVGCTNCGEEKTLVPLSVIYSMTRSDPADIPHFTHFPHPSRV